jgi:hypothetical protein
MMQVTQCKPHTYNQHYTNRESQGTFICQSEKWPLPPPMFSFDGNRDTQSKQELDRVAWNAAAAMLGIDGEPPRRVKAARQQKAEQICADVPPGYKLFNFYSDRLQIIGAQQRHKNACDVVGTGDQGWAHNLPALSEEDKLRFAAAAMGLPVENIHSMRAVFWYNVANGGACPSIDVIYRKEPDAGAAD